MSSPADLSWPQRVVGRFLDRFGLGAEPRAGRRLDTLPYALHLTTATDSIELFPPGPLDVLRFFQRHHCSVAHEVEYVACRPTEDALLAPAPPPDPEHCEACGQVLPKAEDADAGLLAYAVFRLNAAQETPWADLNEIESRLQRDYGSFFSLPRARPLFEFQYGEDLNDEDPPEGRNRVVIPESEVAPKGEMSSAEAICALRADLTGPELISWLESAFRQRPPEGGVEHRYYLDSAAQVYLVRDHFRDGKTLYKAETAPAALGPVRTR
ncbi:MAG: hypothetical protein JKY65_13155 [Planctomycetes bacterium]|nr:hypothetical protein [Planctomycetota bacterium]